MWVNPHLNIQDKNISHFFPHASTFRDAKGDFIACLPGGELQ